METVRDCASLVIALAGTTGLVTLDGFHGSGKSFLARSLATELGRTLVEADSFLREGEGRFLGALRLDELGRTVAESVRPVILEGVCILKVTDCLGLAAQVRVYVRQIDREGRWYREKYLDLERGAESIVEEIREQNRALAMFDGGTVDSDTDALLFEVIRYHHEYKPHVVSEYCFDRAA